MIAVIGAGYWGKNLVRVFGEMGVLGVVCDINPTEDLPVDYCNSVDDVLARPDIDAVVIATPAETHFDIARKALKAKKHVFVEKPMTLDIGQAHVLIDMAKHRKLVLMVGHLMQYHPAFIALKGLINSGELGTIRHITSQRLNSGKVRTTENSLWSFAPHDISMILGLTNEEPDTVSAVGANHLRGDISDITTTHMTFPSGIHASIFVSWLHPYKEQKLIVIGSTATAVLDDTKPWGSKLMVYETTGASYPIEMAPAEPLREECEHFMACIKNKLVPTTDGNEGLRVLRILKRAQESMDGSVIHKVVPEKNKPQIHDTVMIDGDSEIGEGTKIWHWTHILSGVKIGKNCTIGQGCMIGPDVTIGDGCKIQNNVSVYKGVTLADNVFVGPSAVFTNSRLPKADRSDGSKFVVEKTFVGSGASIGANATIVCGNTIGEGSMVGAGAVVTKDVGPNTTVVGTPAHEIKEEGV